MAEAPKIPAHFADGTLDDMMRAVIEAIHSHGDVIKPTKGEAKELRGALIEISNPRARLSRTEQRGRLYSALGELCWYLAKRNDLAFIEYYIPKYKDSADENGEIFGGYGPRLFSWKGNQVQNIIGLLQRKPDSRQAVIQLFDAMDIAEIHKDVPCTCTLQFMNRHGKLDMFVNMRSNDVYWGLPHDVFCFTMLQEMIARSLGLELGIYKHSAGSLHIYTKDNGATKRFLREGWQPSLPTMPAMPMGDPWQSIDSLVKAEAAIRNKTFNELQIEQLDPYWADLIRLLQVYAASKDNDVDAIREIRKRMSTNAYFALIDRQIRRLEAKRPAGR